MIRNVQQTSQNTYATAIVNEIMLALNKIIYYIFLERYDEAFKIQL